jgi:hypothetical protein
MEKAKRIFFSILAFGLPLIFSRTMAVSIKPFLFSQIAIVLLSITIMVTAISKIPTPIRLFYMWCVITTFTSRMPQFSAISLMMITLVILLYRAMVNSKIETLRLYELIVIAVCVQVFWVFAQTMNRDFIMQLPRERNFVFGTLGNKNILGGFFLFSIPFVYMFKRWAAILPIIGIMYCEASAAIFALAGGMLFYIFFINFRPPTSQKFIKFVVICGLIGALFPAWQYVDNPFKGLVYGRWPIWRKTMDLMFAHKDASPIFIQEPRDQALKKMQGWQKETQDKIDDANKTKPKGYVHYVEGLEEYKESLLKDIRDIANLLSVEEYNKSKRAEIWDITLIEKVRNPWLGYGLGTFRFEFASRCTPEEAGGRQVDKNGKFKTDIFGDYLPIIWLRAHNVFLQFGRESGLPGIFFLLLVPGMFFAKFVRAPKTEVIVIFATGVFMICLNALGSFPDRNYALMYYIMLTFAVFSKEVGNERLSIDRGSRFISRGFGNCLQWFAKEIGLSRQGRYFSCQR